MYIIYYNYIYKLSLFYLAIFCEFFFQCSVLLIILISNRYASSCYFHYCLFVQQHQKNDINDKIGIFKYILLVIRNMHTSNVNLR